MYKILYPLALFFKKSKNLSALACHLSKLTGKSKYQIHPKHLVYDEKPWYLSNIQKNDVILDLGCGNGQHSLKVAKKCNKVIGLDYNKKQLEIAKNTAKDQKIKNIQFKNFNAEKKITFKSNFFNKVLCLDVLEHINNRKQLLLEIRRVLKPKGVLFITAPNKQTAWKKLQKKAGLNYYSDPDHKIEYSLAEIENILLDSGFKILSVRPIIYDTPFIGFIDLLGGFSLKLYKKINLKEKKKVRYNLANSTGFRLKVKK
ncbi:class I SAM-dependent methyltransferase [Patescibacteria group bacterium]